MLPRRCSVREPSLTRPKNKQEWPSWSDLCRLCGRLSVVNPGFGDNKLEGEAEPESSAKELMGCEAGNAARCEEEADYGADRGDGEASSEGADHPLTMKADLAAANMPQSVS